MTSDSPTDIVRQAGARRVRLLQAKARAGHDGGLLDAGLAALPFDHARNQTNPKKPC